MQPLPRVEGTGGAGGRPPIQANNKPIPGIDIVVLKKPETSKLMVHTDGDGIIMLGVLTTGDFELTLTAESLHTALGKLGGRQPAAERRQRRRWRQARRTTTDRRSWWRRRR